jgi:hypothetical protein
MSEAVFPVVYSTLASQAIVAEVLSCYEIGSIAACQFWHRGLTIVRTDLRGIKP